MRIPKLQPASENLLHLDLLRFIASVGVVYLHAVEFFFPVAERHTQAVNPKGLALFVDLFFIISGYVIAYVYDERVATRTGYLSFLQRRVGRLIPLHWLTMFVSFSIWGAFSLMHYTGNHMPSFKPLCIADTAFLMHSFIPCGNGQYFNGVNWSISAEMVMYLIFPVLAFLGARGSRSLLCASLVGYCAIIYMERGLQARPALDIQWSNISPVIRALPSFGLGVALFFNRNYIRQFRISSPILAGAVVALIAGMLLGLPQLVLLPGVAAVVTLAVSSDLSGSVSPFVRTVAPLGQLTYSIYMWHGSFILVFMNAIGDKFLHGGPLVMTGLSLLCSAMIFLTSYLSFFYIETPARRWVDKLRLT